MLASKLSRAMSNSRRCCWRACPYIIFPLLLTRQACAKPSKKGEILQLTYEASMGEGSPINYMEVVRARPSVLVNFMVDCVPGTEGSMDDEQLQQCQASRTMKPIFKKLAKSNLSSTVTFAEVDMEENEAMVTKFEVKSPGTLVLFANRSQPIARYTGEIELPKIQSWIKEVAPLVYKVNDYDLNKMLKVRPKGEVYFVARGPSQVMYVLASATSKVVDHPIYKDVAAAKITYFYVSKEGENEGFSLVAHRGINERAHMEVEPGVDFFSKDFARFILKEYSPKLGPIDKDTFGRVEALMKNHTGAIWFCLEQDSLLATVEKYSGVLRNAAAKYKQMRSFYVDESKGPLPDKNSQCNEYPSIIFQKSGLTVRRKLEDLTEKSLVGKLKEASKEIADHAKLDKWLEMGEEKTSSSKTEL